MTNTLPKQREGSKQITVDAVGSSRLTAEKGRRTCAIRISLAAFVSKLMKALFDSAGCWRITWEKIERSGLLSRESQTSLPRAFSKRKAGVFDDEWRLLTF